MSGAKYHYDVIDIGTGRTDQKHLDAAQVAEQYGLMYSRVATYADKGTIYKGRWKLERVETPEPLFTLADEWEWETARLTILLSRERSRKKEERKRVTRLRHR